jgi:serine/threonine-protein kinase RsbW
VSTPVEFPLHEGGLGPLLAWLERTALALGASRDVTVKLLVIAEELFVNTLTHGGGATVSLALERGGPCLHLRYEDQGPAYDPFTTSETVSLDVPVEERPVGGLGITLVKGFAQTTRYHRLANRNLIEVTMDLGTAAGSVDAAP